MFGVVIERRPVVEVEHGEDVEDFVILSSTQSRLLGGFLGRLRRSADVDQGRRGGALDRTRRDDARNVVVRRRVSGGDVLCVWSVPSWIEWRHLEGSGWCRRGWCMMVGTRRGWGGLDHFVHLDSKGVVELYTIYYILIL